MINTFAKTLMAFSVWLFDSSLAVLRLVTNLRFSREPTKHYSDSALAR